MTIFLVNSLERDTEIDWSGCSSLSPKNCPLLFYFLHLRILANCHSLVQSTYFLVPPPPLHPLPLPFQCSTEFVIIFREYLVFRLEPNQLREGGGFWKRPMEVRDTEDGHSESASLDLSLSFRWVVG
jgi:hypothetical protein